MTIPDPLHSESEERLITIGYSDKQKLLVIVHTEKDDDIRIIFVRKATSHEKKPMNKTTLNEDDLDMLDEYDFSTGVRGKYAARYHADKTVIQLDVDVAEMFPDAKSVNDALRTLGKIIAAHGKKAS